MATESDRIDVLQLLEDIPRMSLPALLTFSEPKQQERWGFDVKCYRVLSERLIKRDAPISGFDLIVQGLQRHSGDVRLRQLQGLALASAGAPWKAKEVLEKLHREENGQNPETEGILARTDKDLWERERRAHPEKARAHLAQAYGIYSAAYAVAASAADVDGALYVGINAASTAVFLGDMETAHRIAREVCGWCQKTPDQVSDYWAQATLGEAALVLGEWAEAKRQYTKAAPLAKNNLRDLSATRRQARLLLEYLGHDRHELDACFGIGRVVVFAGHMADQPGRTTPRFPSTLEAPVGKAIEQQLKELDATIGYSAAACGSDILFLEALRKRNGQAHVVLPYDREQFRKDSVDIIPGVEWGVRYENVLNQAARIVEAWDQRMTPGSVTYEYASMLLHGLAVMHARRLDTELASLAVWDGRPGDGPGGTASVVQQWRELGCPPRLIHLADLLRSHQTELSPAAPGGITDTPGVSAPVPGALPCRVMAMLFADALGFGKLKEEQVAVFVRQFLGAIAKLVAEAGLADPPYAPLMKNTWGDGMYFVFAGPREAGRFALELSALASGPQWITMGLPEEFNLRIALHAGPVFAYTNPVTGLQEYVGTHVSRAARIEPITPPGSVYASEPFAALATAKGVDEFACEYVGQVPLAKQYGTFPLYQL
ncbi:MAG: adenylate/guanylate cyclase domain-containing protein, partial [candidate division NC10 bacterium]